MRQPLHYPWPDFDVDDAVAPAIAVRVDVSETGAEVAAHQHRKGQLVFALAGGVSCRVPSGLWMVPTHCAVWIPGGMTHSNIATANAKLFFVYIEPGAADLPLRCCTVSISPLLRELIVELSERPGTDDADALLARLLLAELPRMPVQQLYLPIPPEPRLRLIADALSAKRGRNLGMRDDEVAVRAAVGREGLAAGNTHHEPVAFGIVADRWRDGVCRSRRHGTSTKLTPVVNRQLGPEFPASSQLEGQSEFLQLLWQVEDCYPAM